MKKVITIVAYDDVYEQCIHGHSQTACRACHELEPRYVPCVRYGIVERELHVDLVKEDIRRHGGRYIQTHRVELEVPEGVPVFYAEEVE